MDIIFLDPPHKKGFVEKSLELINSLHLLDNDGIIVVEHHTDEVFDESICGFTLVDKRKYSNTSISFYCKE